MKELRPYQANVLERASEASSRHSSILIVQPTGTGKTIVAVEACARHAEMGGTAMFVAPRRELVNQARAALIERGLKEGRVFVRTIQELTLPGAQIPDVSMVVLDEARHYVADEWSKLKAALPDAVYLGLDATPERQDGRGLAPFFEVLIEAISIRDAVEGGYLVPCETIRPSRSLGADLAQDPFDAWWDHADGASTVIFERSVEAAQKLAARFYDRGIPAAAVWGEMPTEERENALSLFAAGKLVVLTNVQLLTEGWDCPRTECVILAGPCTTQGGLLQRAGRAMRLFEGKERMLLIDPSGCTHDLGDVDEKRTWHLDGRAVRRASDSAEVRFCPVCGAVNDGKGCPQCGYAGTMKKRKPRVLGLPMDRFARERSQPEEKQIRALAQYMRLARAKGYREGWAVKCWEYKYGRKATPEIRRAARQM